MRACAKSWLVSAGTVINGLIVQFRIHQDHWIKRQKTHLYRVSLNLKQNIHKIINGSRNVLNPKIKQYTEL